MPRTRKRRWNRFSLALSDAAPAVRHHHERFDGSGYPDGLQGKSIPWLATASEWREANLVYRVTTLEAQDRAAGALPKEAPA